MPLSIKYMGVYQPERVHRRIRHLYRTDYTGVNGRFQPKSLCGIYRLCLYASLTALLYKIGLVVQPILGEGDEQALCLLHAVGSDTAEYPVLAYAFFGPFAVCNRIAGSAVKQAMVAARSSVADVSALYQQCRETAQRAVPHCSSTGDATADDDYIVFFRCHITDYLPLYMSS